MKWTQERREQIAHLKRMIWLAAMLNRSTNIVGNIHELEKIAEELGHCQANSFTQFVTELALEEKKQLDEENSQA